MTPTQIKYARERLQVIYSTLCSELKKKETIPAVWYSTEQKIQLLKEGKFTINENSHSSSTLILFGERSEKLTLEYTSKKAALDTEYQTIVDELVLGDSDKALEAINSFAKYNV